ncbi:tRNA (N6-threonylcarbamoyladenosine(37)-N6)-methyltransferase TrmO [Halanaerobium sp. ST460_2HS_T2]|uniref:tRNA (N6-threonylcarbamoyladenosine(37)-N6)-methyltransferase TrmO n=1 Tax=Halanaerobium sp. ST460_2HS_T2 TaxID=2183914 RepID=UPI000DF24229|nr:tRNA (N6-threonylcarbamoyladenosine(37)-N6)-methyltransferase TrmO [Halanaerobium sp. ST460_2HS_T2]RCW58685.1 formylmethanofuran dehydrogenase subunit E [Halanaerobium sp. ST460_2HS_T2]
MKVKKIAEVRSKYKEPVGPDEMKKNRSIIEVEEEYLDGLDKIEDYEYLQILFYFHKSEGYDLISKRRKGSERGLFTSRSPRRPTPIGITTVELLKREGNKLHVYGLDAIDGTPVIDIKPYASFMDQPTLSLQKKTPRYRINKLIRYQNLHDLLLKTGELHGHYCPFLALGVLAAADALKRLVAENDGMEDLLAVVESNSCFSDGIQYVAGTTFGNNSIIYRDFGKTAVTFVKRKNSSENLRYYLKDPDFIEREYPEAAELFKKVIAERRGSKKEQQKMKELWQQIAFEIIEADPDKYFKIEENAEIKLPDYAPIFADAECSKCGERLMAAKAVQKDDKVLCRDCAESSYYQLDGSGIVEK